ncbi:MAG TPA: FAD-binding oxidoreductase [Gemmatimonadaceae bacterium]|nr:FAD-binding oxidoreductase [Gemmatimonadaceae bacterium]
MTAPTRFTGAALQGFTREFLGEVLRPGEARYDEARRVWNGMIDRRPAVIVRAANTEDVRRAIAFARAQGLPVAVRGGGHNAAGLAVCDDGLVIDLSAMRRIGVDPARRIAWADGGATWAELDAATQAHGLATTGGLISSTGIAGLTLGGGIGWLMRRHGLACDNLIAAEVVTADGRVVRASETENPELLWGLRGGGGNFGVVTTLEYRLHPVGPMILGGMLVHPLARAGEVLRFYRDFTAAAPEALTVFAVLLVSPEGAPILALLPAWFGPIEEGQALLRPLREFGPPLADQVAPMPYTALQTMLDAGFPSGLQVYWRGAFLSELSDGLIDAAVARSAASPSPLSAIVFEQLGGAVARVGREETAFDHRAAAFNLAVIGRWSDPADAERNIAWTRGTTDVFRPFTSGGAYVNYLGLGEGADRVRAAYGPEKFARLVTLKRQYDPTNVFRFNQNIPPDA